MIYSHKWLSAIDTDELLNLAVEEWSERLHGLTGDDIKRGLECLSGEWPPTPHQFRELCIGDDKHKTGAYKPFDKSKAIEYKGDRILAKSKLAEAKAILSGATA